MKTLPLGALIASSLALSALSAMSAPAIGLELGESTELHGFVNQAYLYSPDNPYSGRDSLNGSFKFREIGLTGFTEFSPELRFAGQLISRRQDQTEDGDVRVDFLLADYLFYSDMGTNVGVRLGRVKNDVGFYNATRDVPSARPGFNVPDAIYFDSLRDTLLATDGVNVYGSLLLRDNQLNWDLFAGKSNLESERLEYYLFGRPVSQGEFDDVTLKGLNVDLVPAIDRNLRLGISLVDAKLSLDDTQSVADAQLAAFLNPADVPQNPQNYVTGTSVDALFAILSAQYSYRDWIITAEYLNIFSDSSLQIAGNDDNRETTSEGYYLQVEWLPTSTLSWFTRYEELYLDTDDRKGRDIALDYNANRGYGRGLSVGGKWAFYNNWTLTGQASFNEGTAWLPSYKGMEDDNIQKYWNYYVLSLTYQF